MSLKFVYSAMKQFSLFWWLSLFFLGSCSFTPQEFEELVQENPQVDIVILGGIVMNGKSPVSFRADVVVRGDSVVYIGPVDTARLEAKTIIHAEGKVITPGFIDTHAHGNPLETPDFQNFIAMGVTTITLGQDGSSPAYADISLWMDSVDQVRPSTNIILFAGHGTLRQLSGTDFSPSPTAEQTERMSNLLADAMKSGCWGISTGLEYTPGLYAGSEELETLARVAGKYDGMIMSHMRNEDDDQVENSIRELLQQGRHCRVHISHVKSVYGKGRKRANELIFLLDSARKAGIHITEDMYPYMASYTSIGIVFPDWARPPHDFAEVVTTRREELQTYLYNRVMKRNGPEATLLGTGPWKGKTLKEIATESGKAFTDVLIDDIGPGGASAAYFVMDTALQEQLMTDSLMMFCSDGSPTGHHPRGHGTFAKIIETYVVNQRLFRLEDIVRKMTWLPAQTLGLKDRGYLANGMKADILVFDPEKVRAKATYENPYQLAEGMDFVLVNGKIARSGDEFSPERNGKVLRKSLSHLTP